MLGDSGIKGIGREVFLALEQPEAGFPHDQVQVGGLGAHRAVALGDLDLGWGFDLEPHAAAVAAAGVDYSILLSRLPYSIQKSAADPPENVANSARRP